MIYTFEEFELDEDRNELRRKGAVVDVLPTPLRLLRYLVDHRDRAIPKIELLDAIWPETVVSETALSSALKQLRKTLGDDGTAQRFVRTRRGHGYRFVPEVELCAPKPVDSLDGSSERDAPLTASRSGTENAISSGPGSKRPDDTPTPGSGRSSEPIRRRGAWWARFAPLDRVLLIVGIPLFLVCYTLNFQSVWRGDARTSVVIDPGGPGEYPTAARFAPYLPMEETGLRAGDTLLRVGPFDLRGVGVFEYHVRFIDAAGNRGSVELEVDGTGGHQVLQIPVVSLGLQIAALPVAPAFMLAGLLLLLGAPRNPTVRTAFHAALFQALFIGSINGGGGWKTWLGIGVYNGAGLLVAPLIVRFATRFPHGDPPRHAAVRYGVWGFALLGVAQTAALYGFPSSSWAAIPVFAALLLVTGATMLGAVTRSYRRSEPAERRQLKVLLYSVYLGSIPLLVAGGPLTFVDEYAHWGYYAMAPLVVIPLSLVVSISRYNLFDIDRVISATVSYNVLGVVLIAGALLVVPRIAAAASEVVGVDAGTSQALLSLLLAGVLYPVHRRLRPRIEQTFFPERHGFDVGVSELIAQLPTCRDASDLAQRTGDGLTDLIHPETCALYARSGDAFVALYAAGNAVPPAFQSDTPLVTTLQSRRTPMVLDERGGGTDEVALDPFDRAVLETLGAHVVLPIERDGALAVILCLGPKRSGDVYTPTDVALLSSVAHTLSLALERFDQAELTRDARKMEEALRRYVPGAVTQELQAGADLESRVSPVSVLFVDIRGHTPFSEKRDAAEVFDRINRYTQEVSTVVSSHGGSVVEFNGDGMMVVFGAPREIPEKEVAAVSAGLDILDRVSGMEAGGKPIRVGVGIASGSAFVGNVQAADRLIWTALGDTTNLAARLEGLTRDFEAAMVIDLATRRAAGAHAAEFELHEQVPIRGRSQAEDLYVLPFQR